MHKIRWSIEALAVGASAWMLNLYTQALHPAVAAQSAMSQLNADVTSKVEVVAYQNVFYLAWFVLAALTASVIIYEVNSYKKEKKDEE